MEETNTAGNETIATDSSESNSSETGTDLITPQMHPLVERYAAEADRVAERATFDLDNHQPCGLETPHGRHTTMARDGSRMGTCHGVAVPETPADTLGSYADMFATYLHEQRLWIGPAQQPLVFHIRKLCRRLDTDDDAPASYSSAYLQAISRLDRQRPGSKQPAGAAGDLPGQQSIFDELDD